MKFTCTQENFSRGLALISRVASKNVALPILNNVLLEAGDDGIQLQATNLEVGVSIKIRGKVEQAGKYTVQSRLLSDFIGLLGHERVEAQLTDAGLEITSGHTQTTLKGLPAEDFPVLPEGPTVVEFSVPANVFLRALEGVVFAAASDESRPEISGVFLRLSNQELVVAATDSYRLSERRCKLLQTVAGEQAVILPARAAQELLRIIPPDDTPVTVRVGENQLHIQLADLHFVSRLIEGKYPEYQQIIPKEWATKAVVDVNQLSDNIRAASLFCKPGINDVTLSINPDKKNIIIQAANTNTGEHRGSLEAEVEGKETSIVFNYRYLLEGISSLNSDSIYLELTDHQAPGVLRGSNGGHDLYLLMPIRQ